MYTYDVTINVKIIPVGPSLAVVYPFEAGRHWEVSLQKETQEVVDSYLQISYVYNNPTSSMVMLTPIAYIWRDNGYVHQITSPPIFHDTFTPLVQNKL